MSAKQITELDADIVAAFEALDATAPEGDLDEIEERLLARLEEEDMSEIANETTTAAKDSTSAALGNARELQGSDDPELRDIKVLAESTKQRISQRMAAQVDAEEALLSASSPSLALRTISLPEPGSGTDEQTSDARPAATAATHDEDAGLPAWIYAAISAVAAAAVVFFLLRGHKSEQPRVAINESPAAMPAEPLDRAGSGQAEPGTAAWDSRRAGGTSGNVIDGAGAGTLAGDDSTMATAGGAQGADEDQHGADGNAKDSAAEPKRAATSARSSGTADTASMTRSARRASATTADNKAGADKSTAGATLPSEDPAASANTAAKKPEKKPDALEDLLAEASGGASGGAAGAAGAGQQAGAAENKPTRTQLGGGDIKKAMTPIGPKAQACYDETQLSGMVTVMIEFRVEPSGVVSSASAKGKFKGTPTGDCVASAVKTATLPAYDGAPMTFTYPFLLTQ